MENMENKELREKINKYLDGFSNEIDKNLAKRKIKEIIDLSSDSAIKELNEFLESKPDADLRKLYDMYTHHLDEEVDFLFGDEMVNDEDGIEEMEEDSSLSEEKLDEKITKFLDNLDYNNDVSREMVESRINEIVVAGDNLAVEKLMNIIESKNDHLQSSHVLRSATSVLEDLKNIQKDKDFSDIGSASDENLSKEDILEEFKVNGFFVSDFDTIMTEELKKDKEFITKMVEIYGFAFEYASEELKKDKEFVTKMVEIDEFTFEYASEELKKDKEFVKEMVRISPSVLYMASEELKNDKEFVTKMVEMYGMTFRYASEELKKDKEFVTKMVEINGFTFKYASEELKKDKEFVKEMVRIDPSVLYMASEELKNDKEFVKELAGKYGSKIRNYVSDELSEDKKMWKKISKAEIKNKKQAEEEIEKVEPKKKQQEELSDEQNTKENEVEEESTLTEEPKSKKEKQNIFKKFLSRFKRKESQLDEEEIEKVEPEKKQQKEEKTEEKNINVRPIIEEKSVISEKIKNYLEKNNLQDIENIKSLFEEIDKNEENIHKLFDKIFIENNSAETRSANEIIDWMNKILGKDIAIDESESIKIEEQSKESTAEPKIVDQNAERTIEEPKIVDPKLNGSSVEPKIVDQNAEKTIEEPKIVKNESVGVVENTNLNKEYNAYNELQNKLNNKLEDLKYLKHEYNVIEKSIYGKSLAEMTKEEIEEQDVEKQKELYQRKRDILLEVGSEKLKQLNDKLSEIKEVQQEIDVLSTKVGIYITKYGLNFEEQYNQKVDDDLNSTILSHEKEERMKSALDEFNYYSDAELAAISKYIAREKEKEIENENSMKM